MFFWSINTRSSSIEIDGKVENIRLLHGSIILQFKYQVAFWRCTKILRLTRRAQQNSMEALVPIHIEVSWCDVSSFFRDCRKVTKVPQRIIMILHSLCIILNPKVIYSYSEESKWAGCDQTFISWHDLWSPVSVQKRMIFQQSRGICTLRLQCRLCLFLSSDKQLGTVRSEKPLGKTLWNILI